VTDSPQVPAGAKLPPEEMTAMPFTPRLQPPRLEGRRVSPHGVISLPFAARVALGFHKDRSQLLSIRLVDQGVVLTAAEERAPDAVKAAPDGVLRLPKEAHHAVAGGRRGRYDLEIYREPGAVLLRPHGG